MATINFKVVHALGLFCLLVLIQKGGDAYEFVVGGQKGWYVPSDPNSNIYNQWAEKSRFQVGDSLGELLFFNPTLDFIGFIKGREKMKPFITSVPFYMSFIQTN